MIDCYDFICDIKTLLENDETVSANNKITLSFEPSSLPNPLMTIYTVLKPLSLSVKDNSDPNISADKVAYFKMGINIHKAERLNPSDMITRLTDILTLIENDQDYTVFETGFDKMFRDTDTNSIVLPGFVTFAEYYSIT